MATTNSRRADSRNLEEIQKALADSVLPPIERLRQLTNEIVITSEEHGPRNYVSVFEHSADAMARVARAFLGIEGEGHWEEYQKMRGFKNMLRASREYFDFEIGMMRAKEDYDDNGR